MDLTGEYIERMITRLKSSTRLEGLEVKHSYDESVCAYPVDTPVVSVGRDSSERVTMLLGGDGSLHSCAMLVSVTADERRGAAFCETCAASVCRAVLEEDDNRYITSVRVERAVYDKSCFAYKVMMSFGLREWLCEAGQ